MADLGPGLDEFAKKPFFGTGFGTRLTSEQDPKVNARILDNEWLGLLIEVGALGVLSLLWLYGRTIRRLGAAARRDDGDYGILMAGLAAAIGGFAVSMFTFDAFSFIQVTFMSFIFLGFAAVALRLGPHHGPDQPGREEPAGPVVTAVALRMRSAVASWVTPSTSSPTGGAAAIGPGGALALSSDRHMTSSLTPRRTPSRAPLPAPDLRRPAQPPTPPTATGRVPSAPPRQPPPPRPPATLSTLGPLPSDPGPVQPPPAPAPSSPQPQRDPGNPVSGPRAAAGALRWIVRSFRR